MFTVTNFGRLLKGLPRGQLDQLVKRHKADKHCKRFTHWKHLVTMVYAQLSGTTGLRPLEAAFNSQRVHHHHLGVDRIRRSTVADANEKRPDTVFAAVAAWLMNQVGGELRRDAKEFLYLLDSTPISLKGLGFDNWTKQNKTSRTQGLKVHMMVAGRETLPVWHAITAANVNDVTMACEVPLELGGIYVFDKGYCDYRFWHKISQRGALFVTRFKSNAALELVKSRKVAKKAADVVVSDEIVRFKHKIHRGKSKNPYEQPLRRITVARPGKSTPLVLATNDMKSSALEIAQRYKERWAIELFFKWIKQHLKIKQFFGRSENAVRIQLLTALISYLLAAILKKADGSTATLWNYLSELRASLVQRLAIDTEYYRRRRAEQAEMVARQLPLEYAW